MYIVYVLKSSKKDYHYVWMTNNIERRLRQHNEWKNKSTKAYSPFEIIYSEVVENSKQAREREKYFKTWKWREEIKKLQI
jgi:putative endonuclease